MSVTSGKSSSVRISSVGMRSLMRCARARSLSCTARHKATCRSAMIEPDPDNSPWQPTDTAGLLAWAVPFVKHVAEQSGGEAAGLRIAADHPVFRIRERRRPAGA